MKISLKFIAQKVSIILLKIGILLFIIGSENIFAQQKTNAASASISATIIKPIGITKTENMNFGNISKDFGKIKDGISVNSTGRTMNPASFQVIVEAKNTYTITLPKTVILNRNDSKLETLSVTNITSIPPVNELLTYGMQTILVNATINFEESELKKNDTVNFDVIVNYN